MFGKILEPFGEQRSRAASVGITLMLLGSAICVVLAASAMPDGYSWRTNSISESAAQGVQFAWISRLSFLLFGCAVLWLASCKRRIWARGTYWMNIVFGLSMIGTAAFSHKPWVEGVPYDRFEDFLHSITATGMGFAFSLGVVARFMQRSSGETMGRIFDIVALVSATALPLLGFPFPSLAGLLQRVLFGVAYVWFAFEAIEIRNGVPPVYNHSLQGRRP